MIDLHEALAREGATWRTTLAEPPDLAGAAARVTTPRRHQRVGLGLAASVAAIAAVAVVGLVVLLRGSGRPGEVPAAVHVGGRAIPYAGTLSFRDAVLDPNDPRVLHVFINKDDLGADQGVCYSERERGVVTSETAGQVRVLVAGYAPAGAGACPGLAHLLSPVAVRLAHPLADRVLVDSTDGRSHPVLDPRTLPQPHRFPPGCARTAQISWNELTGLATRRYASRTCILTVQVGRPARTPHGADGDRRQVVVAGHRALAWTDVTHVYTTIVVEWRAAPHEVIRLRVDRFEGATASLAGVLPVANSIR